MIKFNWNFFLVRPSKKIKLMCLIGQQTITNYDSATLKNGSSKFSLKLYYLKYKTKWRIIHIRICDWLKRKFFII